jgi:flavodoxin I
MKTLILYGSLTGNTEYVAELISEYLKNKQINHKIINAEEFSPEKIKNFDLLILGSSTWDYGQLQEDFKSFFSEIQNIDFSNKKFAAFGCGDSGYEHFCEAINIIEKFWVEKGAEKLIDGLKVDGFPQQQSNQDLINNWLDELSNKIK